MKRWALAQHAVFHTLLCYFFFTFRFETPPHVFCSFSLSFLLVASSASYFRIIRPRLFFSSFFLSLSSPLILSYVSVTHILYVYRQLLCAKSSHCAACGSQSLCVCLFQHRKCYYVWEEPASQP